MVWAESFKPQCDKNEGAGCGSKEDQDISVSTKSVNVDLMEDHNCLLVYIDNKLGQTKTSEAVTKKG